MVCLIQVVTLYLSSRLNLVNKRTIYWQLRWLPVRCMKKQKKRMFRVLLNATGLDKFYLERPGLDALSLKELLGTNEHHQKDVYYPCVFSLAVTTRDLILDTCITHNSFQNLLAASRSSALSQSAPSFNSSCQTLSRALIGHAGVSQNLALIPKLCAAWTRLIMVERCSSVIFCMPFHPTTAS